MSKYDYFISTKYECGSIDDEYIDDEKIKDKDIKDEIEGSLDEDEDREAAAQAPRKNLFSYGW